MTLRTRIIFFSILTPLIIIASAVICLQTFQTKIEDYNERYLDARVKKAIYDKQREDIGAAFRQYQKIQEDASGLSRALINGNEPLKFIQSLEGVADRRNVVQDIRLSSPVKPKGQPGTLAIVTVPIELTVEGSFEGLLQYLHDVESLSTYISISAVVFGRSTQTVISSNDQTLLLRLSGTTVWMFNL